MVKASGWCIAQTLIEPIGGVGAKGIELYGHPNVYADDPGLLGVLNAIGCTEAEIEEITAPE